MKTNVGLWGLILFGATMMACGGGTKNAEAGGEADVSAMQELEGMSADLKTQMETARAPIDKVDPLVTDVQAMPGNLGISDAELRAACMATLETGQINLSGELATNAEAKAEVESLLNQVQTLKADLMATPDNAKALLTTAGEATAKLPVLASKASSEAQAKINAPVGVTAEAKAEAQAQLDSLETVKADIATQIDSAKALSSELPQMATEAMAKLTAAFTAGATTEMPEKQEISKSTSK